MHFYCKFQERKTTRINVFSTKTQQFFGVGVFPSQPKESDVLFFTHFDTSRSRGVSAAIHMFCAIVFAIGNVLCNWALAEGLNYHTAQLRPSWIATAILMVFFIPVQAAYSVMSEKSHVSEKIYQKKKELLAAEKRAQEHMKIANLKGVQSYLKQEPITRKEIEELTKEHIIDVRETHWRWRYWYQLFSISMESLILFNLIITEVTIKFYLPEELGNGVCM